MAGTTHRAFTTMRAGSPWCFEELRTLNETKIETVGDLVFVGTVGEEELGDLRGVKALFGDDRRIDGFISVDNVQVWRVVYAATGSRRYKIAFVGPGGHSFAAFGLPSATHAMGRAIAKISEVRTPATEDNIHSRHRDRRNFCQRNCRASGARARYAL